jgi:isopenicillin N synthase-like dioxygenase
MERYGTLAAPIDTNLTKADHDSAFAAYDAFLSLPENVKESIMVDDGGRNRKAGYVHKKLAADKKQIFHYTDRLHDEVSPYHLPFEAREFLNLSEEFHMIALRGLRDALRNMPRKDILEPVHFAGGKNNHHLRFVAYEQRPDTERLAEAHYDMSTLTIAMCETHPGLRLGKTQKDLAPYQRDPDQPVLFVGAGWLKLHEQLGLTTDLLPTWHDVIQDDSVRGFTTRRMAAILFANPTYLDTAPELLQTKLPITAENVIELEDRGVLRPSHTPGRVAA